MVRYKKLSAFLIIYFYIHTIAGVTPPSPVDSPCEADIAGIFLSEGEIQVTLVSTIEAACTYTVVVNDSTNCICPQLELCQQTEEKETNQDHLTFTLCQPPSPVSHLSISIMPSDHNLTYFPYQIMLNTMKETGT